MCTTTALAHIGGINQTLNWCLTMYEYLLGFFQQSTLCIRALPPQQLALCMQVPFQVRPSVIVKAMLMN